MGHEELISSSCHCINLRRAANAATDYYDRKLRAAGITLNQYSLLSNILKLGSCSVAELSRHVRLDRTTLVRNLKALYAADWICNEASPGSRRCKIHLTKIGVEKIREAKNGWQQAQADIEHLLGQDALRQLTASLLALESLNRK